MTNRIINKFSQSDIMEASEDDQIKYLPSPNKSKNDKKEYRVIKLENGLTALLISDVENIQEYDDESESEDESDTSYDGEDENEEEESESGEEYDESSCSDDPEYKKSIKIEEKMAACALCVGVGSFSDPPEIPGMAHFLEHMIFMGSTKYPNENDFDSFIKRRGGYYNASTDCETTTFYFECHEKHLLQGLDRFSNFFISPLMKKETMTREREAIESEFQLERPSDFSRKQQLLSEFAKPNTPIRKFMWGNLETLKDNVKDEDLYKAVHEFRKRHYSAHRMTLAVQARLPLDTLELWIKSCFKDVHNNQLLPDDFSSCTNVFDTNEFCKMYYVKPMEDIMKIEMTWVFPSFLNKYNSKPHRYIASLLGHNGDKSLLSYLRERLWAVDLFAGNTEGGFEHNSLYCIFMVNITLTDEGIEHVSEIIRTVYSYIKMLGRQGCSPVVYNKISSIEEDHFQYSEETPAVDNVKVLAEEMQFYPPTDYITGSRLYFKFDSQEMKHYLDTMRPNKCNIMIYNSNRKISYTHVEKWFQTEYLIADIPRAWFNSWKYPRDMKFEVPRFRKKSINHVDRQENNANTTENQPYPLKIFSDEMTELWFRQDTTFSNNYAYYYYYLITTLTMISAENAAMLDLLVAILKQQQLSIPVYPEELDEINYELFTMEKGLIIKVYGPNYNLQDTHPVHEKSTKRQDPFKIFVESLVLHINRFLVTVDYDIFEAMKAQQIKTYYNTFLKPSKLNKKLLFCFYGGILYLRTIPDEVIENELRMSILKQDYWNSYDKYEAIHTVTLEQLLDFTRSFFHHLYIQSLVQGNVTQREAVNTLKNMINILKTQPIDPASLPTLRVNQVPLGENYIRVRTFNNEDNNSVITNYYHSGATTIKSSCIAELITMLMDEPVFDVLRTKEQLGYDVSCSHHDTFGVTGFSISLTTRSDKFTCEYVNNRIETFLEIFAKKLLKMPNSELILTKKALNKSIHCVDLDLEEEVERNWDEIVSGDYLFDRLKKKADCIKNIKLSEIRKWLGDHIQSGSKSNFRKLSIQVMGNSEDSTLEKSAKTDSDSKSENTCIENISKFKESLFVYPRIIFNEKIVK